MKTEYLIIGGDAAGLSAAVQIKRQKPKASIQVINKGRIISYSACGMPYVLAGDIPSSEKLIHFTPETFKEKRGVSVAVGQEAVDLLPEESTVVVKDLEKNKTVRMKYEKLLIATGAEPIRLPFLENGTEGIFTFSNIEDLREVDKFLLKRQPRKIAIIGAGNIGLELAEAFYRKGKDVDLFDILEEPAALWPVMVRKAVLEKIREKGIRFHGKTAVREVLRKGDSFQLKTDEGEFETDVIFSVVGTRPSTIFCGNKLEKMKNGALLIDRQGKTSLPGIYAAGDCASVFHRILEKNVYFPLGSTANKMGRIAGMNMAGKDIAFPGIVGTQILKFFELSLAKAGLTEKEAAEEGMSVESFSALRKDKAGYFPGAEKTTAKIVVEKRSGRVLGAEAVTGGNAAQFIDPAAVTIHGRMIVRDLAWMDFAYAPPFAPVWNALISAALKSLKI
ncbi:MAG: FAD-dependent oxidoreductase [Candidatus Aminicenantes bacterium]|nr:FAD-dependent oxidoreductase [Candidatus Aminicenantes bacterium]